MSIRPDNSSQEQSLGETAPHGRSSVRISPTLTRIGRYQIIGSVGRGGFGDVYLAEDETLGRQVAIKVPRMDRFATALDADRFVQEARTAARLEHPHLVSVYDAGRLDDGTPYVVMQYVDGDSLIQRLRDGPPPVRTSVQLLADVADAVHYANRQGFVHRDLKPANILVGSDGRPWVVDFGLALHETEQSQKAGEYSGTLFYMAPEQVRGEVHHLDGRADVWALGVILYEMLTGRRPFDGDDRESVEQQILSRPTRPLRQINDDIPVELERICLKCLAKQVDQRYATAGQAAAELRRWLRPRNRKVSIAAVLGMIAFTVTAIVAWHFGWLGGSSTNAPIDSDANRAADRHALQSKPIGALTGEIDLRIWSPNDTTRRGLTLNETGALPLRAGDQIRIEAEVNRPAYLYILWIDARGKVVPVYPWSPGSWEVRSEEETPRRRLTLPDVADEGWPIEDGPAGMETLLLLARESPLSQEIALHDHFADFQRQPMVDPRAIAWFEHGSIVTAQENQLRAPNFFDSQQIDDPVLRTQRLIAGRLDKYFELIRAVSFANRGG